MIIRLLFYNSLDFGIFMLGAFVFFSAGLLFYDSWKLNTQRKVFLLRSLGFLVLAIVYVSYAVAVRSQIFLTTFQVAKLIGLLFILISLAFEPILEKPSTKIKETAVFIPFSITFGYYASVPISAAIILIIAAIYLLKSTKGYEKQMKLITIAFFFFTIAEIIKSFFYWSSTTNVFWSKILAVHAMAWNLQMFFHFIGIIILGVWVWGYIRFRLQIQLFTTILASIFVVFLATTFFFSFLLLKNLENDALTHLKTDANVFEYLLDRLQLEALSHARAVSLDSGFKEALIANDKDKMFSITSDELIGQNLTNLLSISPSGEVLMRAEDKDNIGENVSEDPVIKSALSGQQLSTLVVNDHPVNPLVFVKSAVPVRNGKEEIQGAVSTGFVIDDAFVDGVKEVTGLDATVFAGDKRSATTIISLDGKSRFTGTIESDKSVIERVLKRGETYTGSSEILNEPYYTAYVPLKTVGGAIIGMIFIGTPQSTLLEAAQSSINLTFIGSVVMMLVAIMPAYLLSRFIQRNIEA